MLLDRDAVTGNVLTLQAIGTCTVSADQAAVIGYSAAPQLSADISVQAPPPLGIQTITGFAPPSPLNYQTTGAAATSSVTDFRGMISNSPVAFEFNSISIRYVLLNAFGLREVEAMKIIVADPFNCGGC